jgi:hypothetical protein
MNCSILTPVQPGRRVAAAAIICLGLVLLLCGCATSTHQPLTVVSKWDRFEYSFRSTVPYGNPLQETDLQVMFTSPSGRAKKVYGFWDGGHTWRVRFSPDEIGSWTFTTFCSDPANQGLHNQQGGFLCTASTYRTRFDQHGPVKVSRDGRSLAHEDGTPFFWLADTTWNGALHSTSHEWDLYIKERRRQNFTAVQWVATQWRAAPDGDRNRQLAFTGHETIQVNPEFFQRLDRKADALNRAGLLNVPVLLWAIGGGSNPRVNPGFSLPEDQAVLLARYMVARWGAHDVVWILGGDGDYRGPKAERWRRIGRAVFGDIDHAPVAMHPGGMHWVFEEFRQEKWMTLFGYQSGHGDDARNLQWIVSGPPAVDWRKGPHRPFINLEPPYEFHVAYQSQSRISPHTVRRAMYWSLLNAPTAGVTYGGHGVWGWDDGTRPPTDHPNSGIPLPLGNAVRMPAAEQMAHLANFFTSIDFWRLRPAPEMLALQPGADDPRFHIAAARTLDKDLAVFYLAEGRHIEILLDQLPLKFTAQWCNPRTGERPQVVAVVNEKSIQFATPSDGDWLLLLQTES